MLTPYGDRLLLPETPLDSEPSYFGFVISVRADAGFQRTNWSIIWKPRKSRPAISSAATSFGTPAYDKTEVSHRRQAAQYRYDHKRHVLHRRLPGNDRRAPDLYRRNIPAFHEGK